MRRIILLAVHLAGDHLPRLAHHDAVGRKVESISLGGLNAMPNEFQQPDNIPVANRKR